MIVTGLYLVIWSRRKDHNETIHSDSDPIDQELSKSTETKAVTSECKNVPQALSTDNNV